MILKSNEGNGVVFMNEAKYEESLSKIVNYQKKFKKLDKDPTILKEVQLQCLSGN